MQKLKVLVQRVFHPREEVGLKIALIGLPIVLVGAAMGFSLFPSLGYWVAACGIGVGLAGVIWHLVVNFFVD